MYEECEDVALWNGYRLTAIDGSVIEIPDTKLLREEFGCAKNQNKGVARARAACIFDVENKIVIKSRIDRYDASERDMAKFMTSEMINEGIKNDFILFDRGYPSAELFAFLIENGINFLIRAAKNYSKEIVNAKKEDQIVKIKYKGKDYTLRVLKFLLPSGEEEILITSLLDKKFKVEDFKVLYFKRWGIEIKYDELKNRLEIENFTGRTRIAIEQDFYASIYLSNMTEFVRKQSDKVIENKNNDKELKYEYKTNLNILIGTLKDKMIIMMLEKSRKKRNRMFKEIMSQVSRCSIPIRPGRSNKRVKKLSRGKYKTNQKRCL